MSEVFFLSAIIISIVGLLIATYTDLKARIVPNTLNYGLAIIGVILFATQSIIEMNYLPVAFSIFGLAYGFAFGWVLWKLGVFAGGDVKLFMGLGALNPLTPAIATSGLFTVAMSGSFGIPLFPITLFIYALIAFLPYGLVVMIYRLAKNREFQKELWKEMKPKVMLALHAMLFTPAVYVMLDYIGKNYLHYPLPTLAITVIIILSVFAWGMLKTNKKYATVVALIIGAILNPLLLVQGIILAMLISVVLYTLIKIMFSSRKLLSTEILVSKLEEGMIPTKSLILEGKKIKEAEGINYKKIIEYAKARNFQPIIEMFSPKKEIISARKARGLTPEEIKEVKKLAAKGLIPKKMLIKESMPFVPTMLLGYLLCIVLGDIALKMILIGVL